MAYPFTLLPAASTWFSNALINAALIQANIIDPLNALAPTVANQTQRLQATQTTLGQSLGSGVYTVVTNLTADFDTFGGGSWVAATGIWTCPATGTYELSGQVSATGATAVRLIGGIQKNGTNIYGAYHSGAPTTFANATMTPKEFAVTLGDTISLTGNPNAAGVVTTSQNGNTSFLRIKRIT